MTYCGNCGNKLREGMRFCNKCGEAINTYSSKAVGGERQPSQPREETTNHHPTPHCCMCGTELNDEMIFCAMCGTAIDDSAPTQLNVRAVHPGRRKTILTTFIVLIFLACASVGAFILNPGGIFDGVFDTPVADEIITFEESEYAETLPRNPAVDVIAALTYGEHVEALQLVAALPESAIDSLVDRLYVRLGVIFERFLSDDIEHSVAIAELDTIEQMRFYDILAKVQNTRLQINNINASRVAFNVAEELYGRSDYVGALAQYRSVIPDDPNFDAAQDGVSRSISAYRARVLAEIENIDYHGTIRRLRDALRTLENDTELIQKLTLIEQSFVVSAIAEVDALLAQGAFDAAAAVVNRALHVVSGDERLMNMRDRIEATRPLSLLTLTPVSGALQQHGDGVQLSWQHSLLIGIGPSVSRAEFHIGAGYSVLRGTITADTDLHSDTRLRLRILGDDDNLIYESPVISRATSFDFEANIWGSQFITITVVNSPAEGNAGPTSGSFTVSDLYLNRVTF